MKKKYSLPILFSIVVLFFVASWILAAYSSKSLAYITEQTNDRIIEREQLSKKAFLELDSTFSTDKQLDLSNYFSNFQLGIYVWQNDSLVFWNNAEFPINLKKNHFRDEEGLVKSEQGYFLYFKHTTKSFTAISCSRLMPIYQLENNYLKNNFSAWTNIPTDIQLDLSEQPTYPVLLNGKTLFGILSNEQTFYQLDLINVAVFCFILAYVSLLIFVLMYSLQQSSLIKIVLLVSAILVGRILMLSLNLPEFLYHSTLYDLKLFGNAQSFLNGYLGDIVLNAFTMVSFSFLLRIWTNKKYNSTYYFNFITCGVLLLVNLYQFNQITASLVTNSTLNFDFLNIFSLKLPVFIALGAIGLHFIAFFITVTISITLVSKSSGFAFLKFTSAYLVLLFGFNFLNSESSYFQLFWPLFYAVILYFLSVFAKIKTPYLYGLQLLFMSLIISFYFNKNISKNQNQDLEILSLKLSEKQDAILENEFEGIPKKIQNDQNLSNLVDFLSAVPGAANEIEVVLRQKYFSGYFDRFNIEFSLFDNSCHPLLPVKSPVLTNQGYFEDQIQNNSSPTEVEGLYYVYNHKQNSRYIGKINLKDKNLFIWIEPKQFEEYGSFPDLLLDQSQQKPEKLKAFSHAVYRLQQVTNRYGDFNYPLFLQDSVVLDKSTSKYLHRYYHPDETTDVIISERAKDWKYFFTFNSYLLLFFSFMAYVAYLIYSAIFTEQFNRPTLTRRIQSIIVTLLFLAMSAVGITSGALVSKQFESDNRKQLDEKTQIIISELNSQFKSEQLFDEVQKETISLKLKEYARLFNTPISLYSQNGRLFNTSESKFYDLGLAASLMNPDAYFKLSHNRSSSESEIEHAGKLMYVSHYAPLFDNAKKLIGFVNLPYFAKQSDLANELSGMISALINVYIILFVISILAGLILSGLITQPLRFIKQQLSHISLGKQNEKIVWNGDDEVGRLVSEYNHMLVKLEKSADLLAQSERESAWREMAKQVAHEIKNPLTPMKLNLQYLQHLIKNDAPDFKEKFGKASAGIIEQIDSLANIASAFSNFAKLPGTQLQKINLKEVIEASQMLFFNDKNVQIVNSIHVSEIWVKGDRDQCLRVFNNLFKNAYQALETTESPRIEISAQFNEKHVIISIKDNGCGIDEAVKAKIFTPNFTTKTSGSGLGLAMVRSAMLGFEGDVSFHSRVNEGTEFLLQFTLTE